MVGNAVSAMLKTDSRTPICQALGDLDELREAVDRLEVYQRLQPEHFDRRHMNARLRTRTETPEGGRGVPHVYRSESGLHPELWRALPPRRPDQYGLCGIGCQSGREQALLQTVANAVEPVGGASAAPDPHACVERGVGGNVLRVVSRFPITNDACGGVSSPATVTRDAQTLQLFANHLVV